MKTKEEIDEYKECIELAKIEVINFLGRTLNKGCYFTSDEIADRINMNPLYVQLALDNLTLRDDIIRISIRKDIKKFAVYYYGWK